MALGDGAMAPQMGTLVHSWAVLCTVHPACQGRWVAPLGLGDESQLPGTLSMGTQGDVLSCGWGGEAAWEEGLGQGDPEADWPLPMASLD